MKTVLITGASRGIGAAAARTLARRGWAVAINYNGSEEAALRLAGQLDNIGAPVMTVQADVADEGQVNAMVEAVLAKFGRIDALVCNAGISRSGLATHISSEDWRRLFAVNVDGVHNSCRAVLPHMINRKSGAIVTLSSMWGQVGASCEVAYSATKGAVIAYTKALAKEVGPSGIRVNCVSPGVIDTDMNASLTEEDLAVLVEETPLGRLGTPDDVARTIAFLLSEEAGFLTGQIIGSNGGIVI